VSGPGPSDRKRRDAQTGGGPLSIGQLLEWTVNVLSRRWTTALAIALLFVAPGALATAAFGTRVNDLALDVLPDLGAGILEGAAPTRAEAEGFLGAMAAYLGATLVAGLLGSIGAVAFSRLIAPDLGLGPADLGSLLRVALGRALSVIVFGLLTSAIVLALGVAALLAVLAVLMVAPPPSGAPGGPGVFAALIIGVALAVAVVYLTLRWAPAYAVMALEGAGWRRALARSWELSAEHVWRTLGVVLLGTIVSLVLAALVAQLLAIVVIDWAAPTFGLADIIGASLVTTVGAVVTAPLTPLLVAVLYVDLRRRRGEDVLPPALPDAEERPPDQA
jgi:hypothetical protein